MQLLVFMANTGGLHFSSLITLDYIQYFLKALIVQCNVFCVKLSNIYDKTVLVMNPLLSLSVCVCLSSC